MTAIDRRAVAIAGHKGDTVTAQQGMASPDASIRATALGALERLQTLTDAQLSEALRDGSVLVRRRAAELSARHKGVDLEPALNDEDQQVVEVAAWACGEHEQVSVSTLNRLIELGANATDALVREAAVAALGAIGDQRGLATIIEATTDKPAVRRRAVLALAPFDGDNVEAAIEAALKDRDWQVRQAAEDLRRAQNL